MPRRCTVCDHSKCEAINHSLINNESFQTISTRFDISLQALKRHKKNHIPELMAKSKEIQAYKAAAVQEIVTEKEAQEEGQADGLLTQLKELVARTERIFLKAEETGDLRTALQAVREGRGNLELMGKVLGVFVQKVEEVSQRPQIIIQRGEFSRLPEVAEPTDEEYEANPGKWHNIHNELME